MSQISRRTVAKGAAWSIPAITVAASAPAVAASTTAGALTTTFYVSGPCTGGGNDHYLYVNVQNNTATDFTLPEPIVLTVTSSATARNHTAATTSWGNLTCNTSGSSMTDCDTMTWTIPAGKTVPANNADQADLAWHFLADFANPTTVSVNVVSGSRYFTNPSTSTDAGWTGTSNCASTTKI